MIINERENRESRALEVANLMATAARTAPKGRGWDLIEVALVKGSKIKELAKEMESMEYRGGSYSFERDAQNILQAQCVLIIGIKQKVLALNCGHCGYINCAEKPKIAPCAMNAIDVGIAVGSACATAADNRVDTRVMFSAGLAAQKLDYLPGSTLITAIPVSISSKSPFFDRVVK